MNEPKQYEVLYKGRIIADTINPIAFVANCDPAFDRSGLHFKQLPDGPLWRVEQETHAAWGGAYQTARLIPAEDGCRKGLAARLQAGGMAAEIEELRRSAVAWEESAAQFHRNECFYRDLIHQIGKPFGVAAMTSDDGSVQQDILALKVPELVAVLQAERDALMGQLTKIGNACIVGITGAAEDGNETDPETLWKAISESVCLGHERKDEANALRRQLAGMTKERDRILDVKWDGIQRLEQQNEALRASLAVAERERYELAARLDDMTNARDIWKRAEESRRKDKHELNASLTAAKAELATCRKARSAAENTLHVLGYERDKVGWFKPNHEEQQSATPPPSAQA